MSFNDWFMELENHCLRAERFYDDLTDTVNDAVNRREGWTKQMVNWLEAAYEMGYKDGRESSDNTKT